MECLLQRNRLRFVQNPQGCSWTSSTGSTGTSVCQRWRDRLNCKHWPDDCAGPDLASTCVVSVDLIHLIHYKGLRDAISNPFVDGRSDHGNHRHDRLLLPGSGSAQQQQLLKDQQNGRSGRRHRGQRQEASDAEKAAEDAAAAKKSLAELSDADQGGPEGSGRSGQGPEEDGG